MTIKSSGAIAMTDLQSEFGGSGTVSLSQFYRGGSFVPNGAAANVNVPASGTISLGSMYGSSKVLTINLTGNVNNYNFYNDIVAHYGTPSGAIVAALTINS